MTIYIGKDYKCHFEPTEGLRSLDVPFFDDKCKEFIEGYKYDDSKGNVAIYPWKPYSEIAEIQAAVDRTQEKANAEYRELQEAFEDFVNMISMEDDDETF